MTTRLERLAAKAVRRLIPSTAHVIVATSGGPDSQALLAVLARFGVTVTAVGIDHGLRTSAAAELDIAEALAKKLGIPFVRQSVVVDTGNVLAQARKARYAALNAIADAREATHIAVAHTATDQLETVLLGFVRGTGPAKGMPERRGRIIRPLLGCRRADVLAFLEANAIAYARDPSNSDRRRSRARLRADVVPVLRELNPRIETAIVDWAAQRSDDEAQLDRRARRLLEVVPGRPFGPCVPQIATEPLCEASAGQRSRALALWLRQRGMVPHRRLVERLSVAVTRTRACITASEGTFFVDAGSLWVVIDESYVIDLPIPGQITLPNSQTQIAARLDEASNRGYGEILGSRSLARAVALDADHLHFQLRVRGWKAGDRVVPFGHGEGFQGSVKVGDLFTNAKVPRAMRVGWPVVVHGQTIVWVVGLRRSGEAPITSRTRRVVTLEVLG